MTAINTISQSSVLNVKRREKAIVSPQGIVSRPTYAFTTDGDCYHEDTAERIFAEIKVRPLGNTDLYVIDRAEFDALKEKYGKGKGE